LVTKKSQYNDSRALNVVWSSTGAHECPTGAMWVGAQIAACVATADCQSLQGSHDSSPRHLTTFTSVCSSCGAALIEKAECIVVHTGCMNSYALFICVLGGSCSDTQRMSLRATAMKQSTPLSSMGPADVVPCLELSVIAPKCREKSVQKVHTSVYKCT
jgi:hypothetical protein